jgi:hypothetical protein
MAKYHAPEPDYLFDQFATQETIIGLSKCPP